MAWSIEMVRQFVADDGCRRRMLRHVVGRVIREKNIRQTHPRSIWLAFWRTPNRHDVVPSTGADVIVTPVLRRVLAKTPKKIT